MDFGNPMADAFNAAAAVQNMRIQREQANQQAKLNDARLAAMEAGTRQVDAATEEMMFKFKELKRQVDTSNMQRALYDYNQHGNPAALRSMIEQDSDFRANINKMGIKNFLNAKDYLTEDTKQQLKQQIAILDGKGDDPEYITSIPDSRIGLIVDNDDNLQWQDTNTWASFVPGYEDYVASRKMDSMNAQADLNKKLADIEGTIANTKLTNQKTLTEVQTTAGAEAKAKHEQLIAGLETLATQFASEGDNEKAKAVLDLYNTLKGHSQGKEAKLADRVKQESYNKLNKANRPVSAYVALGEDRSIALAAASDDILKSMGNSMGTQLKSFDDVSSDKLAEYASANKDVVEDLRQNIFAAAPEADKKILRTLPEMSTNLEKIKGTSPGDVGLFDSYINDYFGVATEDFFKVIDNKQAKIAASTLDSITKAQYRAGGYMTKAELKAMSPQTFKNANLSYKATMDLGQVMMDRMLDKYKIISTNLSSAAKLAYAEEIKAAKSSKEVFRDLSKLYDISSNLPNKVALVRTQDGKAIFTIYPEGMLQTPQNLEVAKTNPKFSYFINDEGKLVNLKGEEYK